MRLIDDKLPLFLTLDTVKIYSNNTEINKEEYEFFIRYKSYIREIHIHDRNKEFGGYQIVGTGNVDFQLFKQFLNEYVYLNFEVRPIEAAKQSKDNIAQLFKI